jgi:hypothetical protein
MKTYLTQKNLSHYLQVSLSSLRRWRLAEGLPYLTIGKSIRYELEAVEQWVADRKSESASNVTILTSPPEPVATISVSDATVE